MTTDPTQGDAGTRVKPCPRCGSDETGHGYQWPPMQGIVQCYADECEALTVADTEAAAIAEWNSGRWSHRIVGYDDDGDPIIKALASEPRHDGR